MDKFYSFLLETFDKRTFGMIVAAVVINMMLFTIMGIVFFNVALTSPQARYLSCVSGLAEVRIINGVQQPKWPKQDVIDICNGDKIKVNR